MAASKLNIIPVLVICCLVFAGYLKAQSLSTGQEVSFNPIATAVPFLTITPDARLGAMGNTGAATSPDANSQYLNPAKYVFAGGKFGFSASYTPWLRKLADDMNLAYVSGFYRLDDKQAIASSLRYFAMGDATLTGNDQAILGMVTPNEFAVDFSYSRKLSERFSGGVALRYIRTDLSGGYGQGDYSAGNAFATDVSFFYNKGWGGTGQEKRFAWGVAFSNIGSKISYNNGQTRQFLPANLKTGAAFTGELDEHNSITLTIDLNKLLVPTPSRGIIDEENENAIVLPDNNSNKSVVDAIFGSFSDAPGGFKEEVQEITISGGLEYLFNKRFALRAGYFNESANKGNRKFFTAGGGIVMNICSLDFSYLMPTIRNNPMANTIRVTMIFDAVFQKNKQ